jgi:CheY-like chemotaxis protein
VVDDNVFNIMTLQTMIETTLRLESEKALNGRVALDLVLKRHSENMRHPCLCPRNRCNYKLIFMDCNMPVMDGFQATVEIRRVLGQGVKIVALTAYATESFEKRCIAVGMDGFFTKPISDDKIIRLIRQMKFY